MFRPQTDPPTKRIRLPASVLQSLLWGIDQANLTVGIPFRPRYPTVTLGTNASLLGWYAMGNSLLRSTYPGEMESPGLQEPYQFSGTSCRFQSPTIIRGCASTPGCPEGGHDPPPRLAVAETDCMEDTMTSCDTSVSTPPTVPAIPAQQSLHPDLQYILESALRPSTRKSYAAKWQRFSNFANLHSFPASSASVSQILQFLFELHQSGLKPSSIKVYTAAISHYRETIHGLSIFAQPLIKRFLRGLSNLHPTIRPLMPTWSLSVVLQALTRSPFEPMATIDLRLASWKTAFLVAVTSARRSSELCALRALRRRRTHMCDCTDGHSKNISYSMLGPAVTFQVRSNALNVTTADVAKAAGHMKPLGYQKILPCNTNCARQPTPEEGRLLAM
ncbi:Receptor-type tyrosine-protein phosphatase N2 [Varanus komodoensis]|nr:Receptor-type tyrosine-protein phosphatase N2 [Varanus komodoensis]